MWCDPEAVSSEGTRGQGVRPALYDTGSAPTCALHTSASSLCAAHEMLTGSVWSRALHHHGQHTTLLHSGPGLWQLCQ